MAAAKQAGMKYIVFTAKHHDGASVVVTLPAAAPDPHVSVLRVTLRPQ